MKKKMENFTMIPNNFINDTRLDVYEFRVLCYLMKLTDDNFRCYPSYGTIVEETGVSLSKTIRAVKKLEDIGIISKECRERRNNAPMTNFYIVCVENAEKEDCIAEGSVCETEGSVCETEGSVCETEGSVCETEGSVCETEGSVCQTEGSVCETPNQYIYTNNHNTNNHFTNTIHGGKEPSGFDEIMDRFDNYGIEGEMRKNYKNALEIMYHSPSITVGNETVPREKVHARLENLTYEHIVAVDRNKPMRLVDGRLISDVRNPVAYIVSALYNCLRYTEDEIVEMEYG